MRKVQGKSCRLGNRINKSQKSGVELVLGKEACGISVLCKEVGKEAVFISEKAMVYSIVLLSLASMAVARVQTICGRNDMKNAAYFKRTEFFRWPMGAIAYIASNTTGCTGFLVGSENYLMTNNHCISTQKEAEEARFYFNYQTKKADTDATMDDIPSDLLEIAYIYTGAALVYTSRHRDSTLLKLRTRDKLNERHGSLALSKDLPIRGEEMYIIHHPGSRPKQVTYQNSNQYLVAISYAQADEGCSVDAPNAGKIIKYVVDEIKEHAGEAVYNDITTSKRLEGRTFGRRWDGRIFAIRSHNGRYIQAYAYAPNYRIVTTDVVYGSWNKFQFLYQNDETYALKTKEGKFIRAIANGKLDQVSEIRPQEKFHLIRKRRGKFVFRTAHHFYITANGKNIEQQFFDGPWETFSLTEYPDW